MQSDLIAQARTLVGRVPLFDDTPEIAEWQDGSYRGNETRDHLLSLHDELKQAAALLTALVERDGTDRIAALEAENARLLKDVAAAEQRGAERMQEASITQAAKRGDVRTAQAIRALDPTKIGTGHD